MSFFASQGGNLYGSQSWPDRRTRRAQMAHQGFIWAAITKLTDANFTMHCGDFAAAVSFETSASGCRRTTGINYRLTCGRVGTNPLRGQPFTSPHGSCEFGKEVWGNPAERKSAYRAGAAGSNRNCDIRCANVNRTCCKMWP